MRGMLFPLPYDDKNTKKYKNQSEKYKTKGFTFVSVGIRISVSDGKLLRF